MEQRIEMTSYHAPVRQTGGLTTQASDFFFLRPAQDGGRLHFSLSGTTYYVFKFTKS